MPREVRAGCARVNAMLDEDARGGEWEKGRRGELILQPHLPLSLSPPLPFCISGGEDAPARFLPKQRYQMNSKPTWPPW
jgi:hypothetical protein